jgi:hypothetical protein
MSLDIYLKDPVERKKVCFCSECDNEHEVSYLQSIGSFNITHNLGKMAEAAGLYESVWRPDEYGIEFACQMIGTLESGLEKLEADPDKYKAYNPPNGWGSYEGLCKVLREYLEVCRKHPNAEIKVCR